MRIGFTGHRPNRLKVGVERLRARLDEALRFLLTEGLGVEGGEKFTALSPLAEGSDRLFAEVALERDIILEVLLPMAVADYVQTFEDKSTTPSFHALLARARNIRTLPGSLSDSKSAYEALGSEMIATSDVLVTVWDAKPAAGRGGTPDVIAEALKIGRRVVWVSAVHDTSPCWLNSIEPVITRSMQSV